MSLRHILAWGHEEVAMMCVESNKHKKNALDMEVGSVVFIGWRMEGRPC